MLFQTCIGIDIRSDRFSVVAVRTTFRDKRIVACSSMDFDSQLSVADKTRLIGDVTAELIRKHHLEDAEIAVMLPRELFIVRDIRLPLAAKENLRTTLGYQMQKYVPLHLSDIYFDFNIIDEDSADNSLRLLLLVIRKKDLEAYVELKSVIGKPISGAEIMASAMSVYLAERLDGRLSGTSYGLIRSGIRDGDVWAYHRSRLAFVIRVEVDQNEDPDSGKATLANRLSEAANRYAARYSDTIWFYYRDSDAESLLAMISENSNLAPTPLEGHDDGLPANDYLPAYALAIQYLKDSPPQINLLPPELRKKPNRAGYYIMFALVFLTVATALLWGGSVWVKQGMANRQLDDALRRLQQEVLQVEKLAEKNNDLERQLAQLSTLYQNRNSVLAILEELSDKIPLSVWIQELNFKKGNIQIGGYADSATDLVQILETSPLFENVVFLSAITRTADGKEKFRIGMEVQGK